MFLTIQKKTLLSFSTLLLLSLMMVFIAQLYIVKILCMIAIGVLMSKKIRVSKFVLLNFRGRKVNCVMRCFSFKLIGRGSASAKGVHQHSRRA